MRRHFTHAVGLLCAAILGACAQADGQIAPLPLDAPPADARSDAPIVDAPPQLDGAPDARPPDAAPDAAPDARLGPDACVPTAETCNGKDDNCNGQIDEGFNLGADCSTGMGACMRAGHTVCSADGTTTTCDAVPGEPAAHELCGNGIDDNCNGLIDEGFSDLGKTCTSGTGACQSGGSYSCSADKLSLVCSAPVVQPGVELCGDGIDNNCDGTVDEGFTMVGMACSAGMGACKRTGNYVCSIDLMSVSCNAQPAQPADVELCGDGIDNNCDGVVDEGFELLGQPCTVSSGMCMSSGKWSCSADKRSLICNAPPIDTGPELCGDGIDNNCNGQIDEGFAMVGMPCTAGVGACMTGGLYQCSTDKLSVTCSAVPRTPSADVCDGVDNDCDPSTPDGSQDPQLGKTCGASASDSCPRGTYFACSSAGKLICSDTTSENTQNDPNNCGSCGHVCSNAHGGTQCLGGQCVPSCTGGYFDCDGIPGNGCETLVSGTSCGGATYLATLSGDDTGDSVTQDGNGNDYVETTGTTATSDWYYVYIAEDSDADLYLSAQAYLFSPSGVNYDLYAYCYSCGNGLAGASTNTATGGGAYQDSVSYRREDHYFSEDGNYWMIEVRFAGGNACGAYQLYINSDYVVDNTTCF